MRLKKDIDLNDFAKVAQNCEGSVFCHTTEGDILNLKSLLTQYVLMSVMGNTHLLDNVQITCVQEEDYQKLADYLEETD